MRKTVLIFIALSVATMVMAEEKQLTTRPAVVEGHPAVLLAKGGFQAEIVREGNAVEPVFAFQIRLIRGLRPVVSGWLRVSALQISFASETNPNEDVTLPIGDAELSICERGYYLCFRSQAWRGDFLPPSTKSGIDRDLADTLYAFILDAQKNFAGADAAFWKMRGEKPPEVAALIDDAFRARAAQWRALATKPEMPEEARKQRVLAESYLREKDFKGAIEHYEAGVAAFPTWPDGWFNLAALYGETGDYRMAADRMKHFLELMPDSADAQAAKDKIIIWEDKAAHPASNRP